MRLAIFFLLLPTLLWARPQKVTVWFLSTPKIGQVIKSNDLFFSSLLASNCENVDEGCFDPQVGWVKAPKRKKRGPKADLGSKAFLAKKIICDPKNPFDIYCGTAKETKTKPTRSELWIDVSGSMKSVDWSKDSRHCQRRQLVENFLQRCKQFERVALFDTSIRQMGDLASLCSNRGTNNTQRMIQWIEHSRSKELFILTDVEENNMEFASYLQKIKAEVLGGGAKDLYLTDVIEQFKNQKLACR
jgi:hypothetical protein